MKSKAEYPFSMYRLFVKIKQLPFLSTVNFCHTHSVYLSVIHILTAFYHLPISLVLFTHSLIDAFEQAQGGLNYTLN